MGKSLELVLENDTYARAENAEGLARLGRVCMAVAEAMAAEGAASGPGKPATGPAAPLGVRLGSAPPPWELTQRHDAMLVTEANRTLAVISGATKHEAQMLCAARLMYEALLRIRGGRESPWAVAIAAHALRWEGPDA